jgi:hypothetical protein
MYSTDIRVVEQDGATLAILVSSLKTIPLAHEVNVIHVYFRCGPLLRYDSIVNQVWYGAILVVSKWFPHMWADPRLIIPSCRQWLNLYPKPECIS